MALDERNPAFYALGGQKRGRSESEPAQRPPRSLGNLQFRRSGPKSATGTGFAATLLLSILTGLGEFDLDAQFDLRQHRVETDIA